MQCWECLRSIWVLDLMSSILEFRVKWCMGHVHICMALKKWSLMLGGRINCIHGDGGLVWAAALLKRASYRNRAWSSLRNMQFNVLFLANVGFRMLSSPHLVGEKLIEKDQQMFSFLDVIFFVIGFLFQMLSNWELIIFYPMLLIYLLCTIWLLLALFLLLKTLKVKEVESRKPISNTLLMFIQNFFFTPWDFWDVIFLGDDKGLCCNN